jgi:hypothetical protein
MGKHVFYGQCCPLFICGKMACFLLLRFRVSVKLKQGLSVFINKEKEMKPLYKEMEEYSDEK